MTIEKNTIDMDRMLYAYSLLPDDVKRTLSINALAEMRKALNLTFIPTPDTEPRPVPTCDWQEDADGIWETSCGEAWVCTEGTPAENNMKFCHSCGKHLKEHRYAEPDGGVRCDG